MSNRIICFQIVLYNTLNSKTYTDQLKQLSAGKLQLEPPRENGLTAYATSGIYEMGAYIKALEEGYRRRGQEIRTLTALLRKLPKRLRGADEAVLVVRVAHQDDGLMERLDGFRWVK